MEEYSGFSLIRPAEDLMEAYLDFCRETWGHVHDDYILNDPAQYEEWRHTLLRKYRDSERGIGLPEGFVPSVTYWIMKTGGVIGVVNIRPELNDRLRDYGGHIGIAIRPSCRGKGYLRMIRPLLLEKTRDLGIREILLTGEVSNISGIRSASSFPNAVIEYGEGNVNGKLCKVCRIRIPVGE